MKMDPIVAVLQEFQVYILAAAFALARMAGLMLLMPLFSRVRLTGVLRNGVALALALPLIPMIADVLGRSDLTLAMVLAFMLKEVLVGATLGIAMGIPFWAAEAAGEILDLQRGSTMGSLIDPMMTHETSTTGTFLAIIMVALYLAAGGLELTLNSFYDSYSLWPIDRLLPVFSEEAATVFLGLLTQVLTMALTMVFPLIICMLLSDLVLAFLARASPHLNIFALSLIVKTLVFSLVLVLYAAFLIAYMSRDLGFLNDNTQQIEAIGCRDCL
ncbi:EscT/YscT/HrcT family type III secretion system export apparatus protein [Mesorhizobium sp. M6A.T.Cr.TU.014.01.1.1]|nr:EscT/YscT/HrcT family type III secretion system export apparatus protein [Mesorhizobium sp. M6A.T.Cr.TU.014.01.1.1]RWQ06468.1 MAG: EscT/YscT/HrcT family type III secretion system export apparatus protein [Mesorhizobium sp.]RWQ10802.1 MAG: EscT/YscT/HrcT family type III secretion system export apparatus protein [Mesorhizobium sp.]